MDNNLGSEKFDKLSPEEANAEIIKLAMQVPAEKREEVIAGIERIIADEVD